MRSTRRPTPPSPQSAFRPLPDRGVPRESARTRRLKAGLFSIGAIALVAFSMAWNPPTGRVHSFTRASDYVAERDSGCTNSGEGCHGTESSYTDFNDYHPNTTCATCHEYQGVGCIPCHAPEAGSECQSCHDGTMDAAPDRERITDPYPRGHYRESTHTATGTDMKAAVRASEAGRAKTTCLQCHSRDLSKAHRGVPEVEGSAYGKDIGCGECHNDTRSFGLEQVLSGWKRRRCEDCHREDSSSPMHAADIAPAVETTGRAGCGSTGAGCHEITDTHALHDDAPKDCSGASKEGEPGCHDLTLQAHVPTATACGAGTAGSCHAAYENDRLTHEKDDEVHSPGPAAAASERYFGVACGSCHDMRNDGRSLVAEHALPTSSRKAGGPCRGCHNDDVGAETVAADWPERRRSDACEACHGRGAIDPVHGEDIGGTHVATVSSGCAMSGVGCHDTDDLSSVGENGLHRSCLRCHDRTRGGGNQAYTPGATSCGAGRSCHNRASYYRPALPVHRGEHSPVDGADGLHTAGLAQRSSGMTDAASGVRSTCDECHSMSLGPEHTRPNAALARAKPHVCAGCHNASRDTAATVKSGWPSRSSAYACEACHGTGKVNAVHHDIDAKHAGRSIDTSGVVNEAACVSAGCHATTDLRVLHAKTGCSPDGCHQSTGDIRGRRVASCGGADAATTCHIRIHDGVDGTDAANHRAGVAQAEARWADTSTGASSACADCHSMTLGVEHSRPGAGIADGAGTLCDRCHAATPGVRAVVGLDWPTKDSDRACEACHGRAGIDAVHHDIEAKHRATTLRPDGVASATACARAGCHKTADLRLLHKRPGCGTRGCHQATGDIRGRAITACGGADSSIACHASKHEGVTGDDDAYHRAGDAQANAVLSDPPSGLAPLCLSCHTMRLTSEHTRPNSSIASGRDDVCARCHDANTATREVVDGDWAARGGAQACASCHRAEGGASTPHARQTDVHFAVEIEPGGAARPGYCATVGCHTSNDVRRLHSAIGCTAPGCHQASGDIRGANVLRCGGADDGASCHPGFSMMDHRQDHSADLTGTVNGVTYRAGENVGCFGCHRRDLRAEHSNALLTGSMDGGGASTCHVCHFEPGDAGNGLFASLPAVSDAIGRSDRRCVACHRSGDEVDGWAANGPAGVASPHRVFSTQPTLPPGSVWTDPLGDWRAALDAPTGGGHNTLPASVAGASRDKVFPLTSFMVGGQPYVWALPPNSGTTAWLRTAPLPVVYPRESPVDPVLYPDATTTAGVRAAMVTCEDCHEMGDASGPQGAAVAITMAEGYSATEWANPTPGTYPFDPFNVDVANPDNPPGNQPVICVKCHLVYARAREGTTAVTVGGHPLHGLHKSRVKRDGSHTVCVDCHVRIPHAWKRPRLLIHTEPADGIDPDHWPYVARNHAGQTGMKLVSVTSTTTITQYRGYCSTGGCYTRSSTPTDHPTARELSTGQAFWP